MAKKIKPISSQTQKEINAAYMNAFGRNANAGEMSYYGQRGTDLLQKNLRGDVKAGGIYADYRNKLNPVDNSVAGDTSQSDLITKIREQFYPKTTPPPSFENSGLWNEADVKAQAEADYNPTFQTEQQRLKSQQSDALRTLLQNQNATQRNLEQGFQQSSRNLGIQQQQDTGNQLSNYYNRGLSKSGAFQGTQQNLAGNQAYDTNLLNTNNAYNTNLFNQNKAYDTNYLTTNQGYDTAAQQQAQKATLAGVKNTAYANALQRYLNQFNTK